MIMSYHIVMSIDFTYLFGYHPLIRNLVYFLSSLLCSLFLYIVYLKNEEDREGSISLEHVSSLRSQLFGEKSNCFLYKFAFLNNCFKVIFKFVSLSFL